jgi:hypothetical protein
VRARKRADPATASTAEEKCVRVSCVGSGTLPLEEIRALQGDLKTLSEEAHAKLRALILRNGITAPVHIWTDPRGSHWNLDGHQRAKVLGSLAEEGYAIPPVPIVDVKAENLAKAKEILLSNAAQFGRIDQEGLYEFIREADISVPELVSTFEIPNFDAVEFQQFFESGGASGSGAPEQSYTRKVVSPVYEPKGEKPDVSELCDLGKVEELLAEIEAADLPEDEKEFLRRAASRHAVFNYEKIAEFYAHAPKKLQTLMENSALVIIDFGKAIEKGFVTLSEKIADVYRESESKDGDEE